MGGRNNVLLLTIALSALSSEIKASVAKRASLTVIDCPQGTFNKQIEAQQWCWPNSYSSEVAWSCWGQPEINSIAVK